MKVPHIWLIPHTCERIDCEHNHNGTHANICWFFGNDVYFLDCLKNATMYTKKTKQPTENSQINPEITNIIDEHFWDMIDNY